MAFDDGNFQDQPPADQADPPRLCDNCGAVMKPLGTWPAMVFQAAARIFRCYACNLVVADRE